MKKLLTILVLGLLWSNVGSTSEFEWIKNQTEFKNSNKLLYWDKSKRFETFLRANMTTKEYSVDNLIESMSHPEYPIKYLDNKKYVIIDSCMYKFCTQKGLVFIDTINKEIIGINQLKMKRSTIVEIIISKSRLKNWLIESCKGTFLKDKMGRDSYVS